MDTTYVYFQPPYPVIYGSTSPDPIPSDLMDLSRFSFNSDQLTDCLLQIVDDPQHSTNTAAAATSSEPGVNLLEVISTTLGKPSIIYNNNLFQERSQLKENISFRCSLYHSRNGSCPATIKTDKERSLVLEAKGSHNHPDLSPNTLNKKRKTHQITKTYGTNPDRPVRVVTEVVMTPSLQMKHSRIRNKTTASECDD